MNDARKTIVFIGGPDTGKSNYLFRAWLAIKSKGNLIVKGGVRPSDMSYLNAGADAQLAGGFAGHTSVAPVGQPRIPITIGNDSAVLVLPDGPGEDWVSLYRTRRLPEGWEEYIGSSSRYLLFARADVVEAGSADWLRRQRFRGPDANFRMTEDFRSSGVSPQVLLVDWLQILERMHRAVSGPAEPFRAGIMLTAWDKVDREARDAGPEDFLRQNHPLLHQFIETNTARSELRVFGTSIFGGDLDDPKFQQIFRGEANPAELGYVEFLSSAKVERSDILCPVAWALS